MKQGFVKTSNVSAYLAAIEQLNRRTAPEAAFVVAAGDAGFGKTRTLEHWAVHNKAVYVRLKNGVTIHWLLKDTPAIPRARRRRRSTAAASSSPTWRAGRCRSRAGSPSASARSGSTAASATWPTPWATDDPIPGMRTARRGGP